MPTGATIKNVEIINVLNDASNDVDASGFQGAQQIWQIGGAGSVKELATGTTAGFRGSAITAADATYADGVTAGSIALDGVANNTTVTIAGTDLSSATVSGSVAANPVAGSYGSDLTINIDNTGNETIDTLNLALSNNVELSIAAAGAATLETVDASDSTGGIRIGLSSAPDDALALENVTLGSGGDVIVTSLLSYASDTIAYDLGAGNDRIDLGLAQGSTATSISLTLGAGDDIVAINVGGNVVAVSDADDLVGSLVSITDFAAADDVLDVSGVVGTGNRTTQNLVDAALSGATISDLHDAVTAVAGVTGNGNYSLFAYNGNTYFYAQTGTALDLDAGDTLIELQGIAVADISAANFIA